MSDLGVRLFAPQSVSTQERHVSVGRRLIEKGVITPWQLFYALDRQYGWDATLTEILVSKGWITQDQALETLSEHYTAQHLDLDRSPPDKRLSHLLPPEFCLKHNVIPWMKLGGLIVLATGRPDRLTQLRLALPSHLRGALISCTSETQVADYIAQTHRKILTQNAETRVSDTESCRHWSIWTGRQWAVCVLMCTLICAFTWQFPQQIFALLMIWAIVTLVFATGLKLAALFARLTKDSFPSTPPLKEGARLPRVSVLVPLFREPEIVSALISRLSRLTYPKALLDIVLVVEEQDTLTHAAIQGTNLPHWMRMIEVPTSDGVTTKPRALNYALDFCRGDIIGIWDAEDAPAPDQLEKVAHRFASAPAEVACLQGILDYYNPDTNWFSRCFTLEYATWFRVMLPGVARLGLAIPLGGTTVFFRRDPLEKLGGWDSHNVTEDADLGIRLARHGYRTELINSVTQEEANCRFWPWIRQRSRWLKGYMVTYCVHMRAPVLLYRQLGARKFWGFQIFFLTTLSQFLLAPLIWSFWLTLLGNANPLQAILPETYFVMVWSLFLFVAAIDIVVPIYAIHGQGRARLIPWVLTLGLYFPMATIAAYKGLLELVFRPFFWDKTAHAQTDEGRNAQYSGVGV